MASRLLMTFVPPSPAILSSATNGQVMESSQHEQGGERFNEEEKDGEEGNKGGRPYLS